MNKIAVFADESFAICDFFTANRFLVYEKKGDSWVMTKVIAFEKVVPSTSSKTRALTTEIRTLIEDCDILAGGTLVGIPYSVFDRAGLYIFEISAISEELFDEIIKEVQSAGLEQDIKNRAIMAACPTETDVQGIYVLDLITLQSEYPEVSSKKAMANFLENESFTELHLTCKHIPPWIENNERYDIKIQSGQSDVVKVIITRRG